MKQLTRPLAITMWDFSWLERRWPGAGYEDIGVALDGLVERGYDAVRMDPYPHLLAVDPDRTWKLEVLWTVQDWGSPAPVEVNVRGNLIAFLGACRERGLKVGLSSWFRKDSGDVRRLVRTPEDMARIWQTTLELIRAEGLLDTVLYVDLCNEWPGVHWAPFFVNDPPELTWGGWHTALSMHWMRRSVELLRAAYPDIPLTYSFNPDPAHAAGAGLQFLDFFEPHIWMAQCNQNEFYRRVSYDFPLDDPRGYYAIQQRAKPTYNARPEYWQSLLVREVQAYAEVSRQHRRPLATTECWGLVDYKDWPLLDWGWIRELCELATLTAVDTGRWWAVATSNFCGPQFHGMWRDIPWHRRLTDRIHAGRLPEELSAVTPA
jgi:hypothetical protein